MIRSYRVTKGGQKVSATLHGKAGFAFRPVKEHEPIARERVFAVDTESLTAGGELRTLLTTAHFAEHGEIVESPDGRGMLVRLCRLVLDEFAEPENCPSWTKQRAKQKNGKRDGRRQTLDPVLSVWFNLAYDIGRLAADLPNVLKSMLVGADSYRVRLDDAIEIEVVRMHFGSSSSFEWFIRDKKQKTIARLLGIDLTGYWKTSLKEAAKTLGVSEKVDVEKLLGRLRALAKERNQTTLFEIPREEWTDEEWALFAGEYALGDVKSTLELYHKTVELLTRIDARVVRKNGVVPPSAPGAAARITFARAFDIHPDIESWERAPQWADQFGCDSYHGGRVFCVYPGRRASYISLDIKSAYPWALACLPDPVTARYRPVSPRFEFEVALWRGRHGVLEVDGFESDDKHPALRVFDETHKRLRYVVGRFEGVRATIPEIVCGVLSGSLRIDRIRSGVLVDGSPDRSFLREGMRSFFGIKNDASLPKPLRDMAKLLAVSTYGKLVEVNAAEYTIAETIPVPNFAAPEVAATMARIYASEGPARLGKLDHMPNDTAQLYADIMETIDEDGADRRLAAVLSYVEALTVAGEPFDGSTTLGEYMRAHTRHKCGQYFMPLYASMVTGLTSAVVGLLAKCVGAHQGDTDSVHVQVSPDFACRKDQPASELGLPGFERFEELFAASGYNVTIPGFPELGRWMCESPRPSFSTVLVRPKVYSHGFATDDGSTEWKQAKHGFAKWPRDKAALHEFFAEYIDKRTVTYPSRPSPRKLRQAVLHGKPVGEFTSHPITMTLRDDPNTWRDAHGFVRWKPFDASPDDE
jgi:hypothetical protein